METRFYLKKLKGKEEGMIQFQFSADYRKLKISSRLKISINDWEEGYPKKIASTKGIRHTLSNYKNQIDEFISDSIKKNDKRKPTKYELSNFINVLLQGHDTNRTTISTLIDVFLDSQKNEIAKVTMTYKRIQLAHFSKTIKADKLTITDLTDDIILKYRTKLVSEKRENTTTNKYICTVHTFLNWLKRNKYTPYNLAESLMKLKEVKKDVIALNEKELKILENANLKDHLQNQVDVFLIGCYTALGISDIKRITKDSIEGGYIKIRRKKTGKFLRIPILSQTSRILEKHDYKLPCISDNKGNESLKEAFKKLKINRKVNITRMIGAEIFDEYKPLSEVISWHKARKTAITIALQKGIPDHTVMQLSGHSKYESMKPYIDKADDFLMQEMMEKLNKP